MLSLAVLIFILRGSMGGSEVKKTVRPLLTLIDLSAKIQNNQSNCPKKSALKSNNNVCAIECRIEYVGLRKPFLDFHRSA